MQRYDFWFRQPVAEDEMDAAFTGVEQALWNVAKDTGLVGVMANAVVTEHAPQNETVDVSGSSVVYDKSGERIYWGPSQNVDVSTDYLGVSTAVVGAGNEKIVSVFASFERVLSVPQVDGNSATVYWNRAESFDFVIAQGAEGAAPAVPPALDSEMILLADIRRAFGDTTIANADITGPTGTYAGHADRREDAFVVTVGSDTLRAGTPEAMAQALFTHLASGASIAFSVGAAAWADTSSLSAADLQSAIQEILTDLNGAGAASGAYKVSFRAAQSTFADAATQLASTAVQAAVDEVVTKLAANTGFALVGADLLTATWENGDVLQPATDQVSAMFELIVTKLAAKTSLADSGADRVGGFTYTGNITVPTGSMREQIEDICDAAAGIAKANTFTLDQTLGADLIMSKDEATVEFSNTTGVAVPTEASSDTVRIFMDKAASSSAGKGIRVEAAQGNTGDGGPIVLQPGRAAATGQGNGWVTADFSDPNGTVERVSWCPLQTVAVAGAGSGSTYPVYGGAGSNQGGKQPYDSVAFVDMWAFGIEDGAELYAAFHVQQAVYRLTSGSGGTYAALGANNVVHSAEAMAGSPAAAIAINSSNGPYLQITGGTNASKWWGLMKITCFERVATADA